MVEKVPLLFDVRQQTTKHGRSTVLLYSSGDFILKLTAHYPVTNARSPDCSGPIGVEDPYEI